MTEYFEDLLATILDAERSLNPSRLSELSDPTLEHVDAFRRAWFETSRQRRLEISQHLSELAKENIELLFERINRVLLEDPEPAIRRQAIENLWEIEDKKLALDLTNITREDPDPGVRLRAAEALGRFIYLGELDKLSTEVRQEVEATLQTLLLESDRDDLRRQALESLGYSSQVDLKQQIEQSYTSESEEDLRSSLVAMGRSADPVWREEIEAHINHPAPRVRAEAARAIGEIQSRGSAALLLDLLDDPKDSVKIAAIWALGQIGGDRAREALEEIVGEAQQEEFQQEIEQALEHIAFLDSTPDLMMFELSPEED